MMNGRFTLARSSAFRFVLIMGVVNLFADMTYEGARSVSGPFLAYLGASGLVVGIVAGFGEFIGYGLRYISGAAADRSGKYWTVAFVGYIVNLLAVPALALAHTWPAAAGLIVGERFGRGIRKPATAAMLSHAGSELGQGWVFGFNEALDQAGATIGPLIVALIIGLNLGFNRAFAVLLIPAILALIVLAIARREYPSPSDLEVKSTLQITGYNNAFWIYALAGALLAAGFADFALISFHFSKAHIIANHAIPILYAVAMLAGAVCAPFFGNLYDRFGIGIVIAVFGIAALFAPLCFLGSFWPAVIGVLVWGLGMAAENALLPSIIAKLVPPDKRATAIGAFDMVYGIAWFAGSVLMGALYDHSIVALVVFSLVLQIAALPLLMLASRRALV